MKNLTPHTDGLCCICGAPIEGYGYNAEPICAGRCCHKCNYTYVLPTRHLDILKQLQIKKTMERPSTTFHLDFRIAEAFGIEAVKDTFDRAFKEWRTNYLYLTEFVIVLNHRCWMHYDRGNHELSKLYADYYYEAREYALDNLKGEEFEHFFDVTDQVMKVGDKIRIIHLSGEDTRYDGKEGTITYIDSLGQLHGTWGGLAVIPEEDDFEILNN